MFEEYIKTNEIVFKHAKGMRDIIGKEFHTFHEIFLLIGNTAKFTSDHLMEQITPYSLVLIPKEQFHQFDPIGEEKEYHRYVFKFDAVSSLETLIQQVMTQVKIIRNPNPETIELFQKLAATHTDYMSRENKEILLNAVFSQILLELKYQYTGIGMVSNRADHVVSEIIAYIDHHYLEKITIRSISQNLNFSESFICHKFKERMNISLYNYILKRKLTHAYTLIQSGVPATDAAESCGFREYSGFYKMYKKYIGNSPSRIDFTEI